MAAAVSDPAIESYHENVHRAAAAWGVPRAEWPDNGGDPPEYRLDVVETLVCEHPKYPHMNTTLDLLRRGDLWSFCFSISTNSGGSCYGPFMKFCAPYPSRHEALQAAVASMRKRLLNANDCNGNRSHGKTPDQRRILRWLWTLPHPGEQLALFG